VAEVDELRDMLETLSDQLSDVLERL